MFLLNGVYQFRLFLKQNHTTTKTFPNVNSRVLMLNDKVTSLKNSLFKLTKVLKLGSVFFLNFMEYFGNPYIYIVSWCTKITAHPIKNNSS